MNFEGLESRVRCRILEVCKRLESGIEWKSLPKVASRSDIEEEI